MNKLINDYTVAIIKRSLAESKYQESLQGKKTSNNPPKFSQELQKLISVQSEFDQDLDAIKKDRDNNPTAVEIKRNKLNLANFKIS